MCGVKTWGLEGAWKEIYKIHEMLCKELLYVRRSTANGVAVLECGRNSRRGRC
jgi:hypothetical protein